MDVKEDITEKFRLNTFAKWLGISAVVIVVVVLLIAGFGIGSSLLLAALIGLVMILGSIRLLAASLVITMVINMTIDHVRSLLGIWFTDPRVGQTLDFLDTTPWVMSCLALFVVLYFLSTVTSCFRFFHFNVNAELKLPKEEDD